MFDQIPFCHIYYYQFQFDQTIIVDYSNSKDLFGLSFNLGGSIHKKVEEDCLQEKWQIFYYGENRFFSTVPAGTHVNLLIITFTKELLGEKDRNQASNPFFYQKNLSVSTANMLINRFDNGALYSHLGMYSIALELIENQINDSIANKEHSELKAALQLLEESIQESFPGIDQLASVVNMSPSTFKLKFKSSIGMSPLQYFTSLKIQWAQKLLTQEKPISDIAYTLGYQSPSSFAQVFKKQTGVTPSGFIESMG